MRIFLLSFIFTLCLISISCSERKISGLDKGKIISMSPGITETLFFIGAGDRIIGTSGHCSFPEEAKSIQVVGGISELNYEFVIRESPVTVFLMPTQSAVAEKLERLGVKSVTVPQETVQDILESFVITGIETGMKQRGETIKDSLTALITSVGKRPEKMRVLVSAGREYGSPVSYIYSSGRKGFLNDILDILGHENALDTDVPYPKISAETIITVRPDVILDLVPYDSGADPEALRKDWDIIKGSGPSENPRIIIVAGTYTTVPGPRLFDLINDLRQKGL